jgi:hypothetical protein
MGPRVQDLPAELLDQLLALVDRLREESAGYLEEPGDQQLWYNRGYANGMVLALLALGQDAALGARLPDDPAQIQPHGPMPWGRAYRHGEDTGRRETHEITGIPPA